MKKIIVVSILALTAAAIYAVSSNVIQTQPVRDKDKTVQGPAQVQVTPPTTVQAPVRQEVRSPASPMHVITPSPAPHPQPQPEPQPQPVVRYDPRGDNPRNDYPRNDHHNDRHHGGFYDFGNSYPVPVPIFVPAPDVGVVTLPSPNVYVVYSGSDAAGADFANSVQRHIQAAGDLVLVGALSDATLELYITSMDIDPSQPGTASAVSVTYVQAQDNRFITTQVFPVMAAQVEDMAASETNSVEQLMQQLR